MKELNTMELIEIMLKAEPCNPKVFVTCKVGFFEIVGIRPKIPWTPLILRPLKITGDGVNFEVYVFCNQEDPWYMSSRCHQV